MNQCDGCKAGMELRGVLHYDRYGRVNMMCERERYVAQPHESERAELEKVDPKWRRDLM